MLTDYKVKAITYPNGEYILGKAVPVVDEGSFYRVDGTHIFDKFRIQEMIENGNQIILKMKDKDVVLTVDRT